MHQVQPAVTVTKQNAGCKFFFIVPAKNTCKVRNFLRTFINDAFEAGQFTELVYRHASSSFYKVEQVS